MGMMYGDFECELLGFPTWYDKEKQLSLKKYKCKCLLDNKEFQMDIISPHWESTYPYIIEELKKHECPTVTVETGTIIGVWCNGYPNCACSPVPSGEVVEVEARMKNNATTTKEFRFYLKDADTGEVLAKYPQWSYMDVGAGEEWHCKSGLADKFNFKMPAKNLKLDVELWRQL